MVCVVVSLYKVSWGLHALWPLFFKVKRKKSVADGECRGADEGGGTVLHNESFSDDEDELVQYSLAHSPEDGGDPNAKFNRSWIK